MKISYSMTLFYPVVLLSGKVSLSPGKKNREESSDTAKKDEVNALTAESYSEFPLLFRFLSGKAILLFIFSHLSAV